MTWKPLLALILLPFTCLAVLVLTLIHNAAWYILRWASSTIDTIDEWMINALGPSKHKSK